MKALIFDLDDTLFEISSEYKVSLLEATLKRFNVKTSDPLALWYYHFDRDVYGDLGLDRNEFWNEAEKILRTEWDKRLEACKPFPDVHMLKHFKEMGFKLGIVTGTFTDLANAEIQRLYQTLGERVFNSIVIANKRVTEVNWKPSPEGALIALKELRCGKEGSFMIGNGREDIQCGKTAGLKTVLVERTKYEQAIQENADYRVKNLEELKTLLEQHANP